MTFVFNRQCFHFFEIVTGGLGNGSDSSSLSSMSMASASASGRLCSSIILTSEMPESESLDSESEDSSSWSCSCINDFALPETSIIEDFHFFKGGSGIGMVQRSVKFH